MTPVTDNNLTINTLKIRNITIGEGTPKICVPIVGRKKEDILAQARSFDQIPVDVVEWRVDWFEQAGDVAAVLGVLKELREILGDTVLLMTFRTSKEGGERAIAPDDYEALNIAAAESGYADLIDVEIFTGDDTVSRIIGAAHDAGVYVIASNHDFDGTPDKEDMIGRLNKMQQMGADLLKIAVMPHGARDLLTLLDATEEMNRVYAKRPVITMSMGGTGVLSRICGEVFGSVLTFGAAGCASAPGQMKVEDLHTMLQLLHAAM